MQPLHSLHCLGLTVLCSSANLAVKLTNASKHQNVQMHEPRAAKQHTTTGTATTAALAAACIKNTNLMNNSP